MKINRWVATLAVVAAGAVVLSGCSSSPKKEISSDTSIKVAWNQPFYSYNKDSSTGNNVTNANLLYMTYSQFNYYNKKSELIRNKKFGTYKKIKDDPMTIKYTINKDVKWSDGTPVDAADMLLSWVATSGVYNDKQVQPKLDDKGNVTNQKELDKVIFFNAAAIGAGLSGVTKVPTISDDGRSMTVVYDKPDVAWEVNFTMGLPAHAVVEEADPSITDAKTAKKKLIKAIQDKDVDFLRKVSSAWNTKFDMPGNLPKDKKLYLSDGAYILTALKKGQYATLTKNPDFTWGHEPKAKTITIRFINNPLTAVQALQNGEVDIIQPQSTQDILKALDKLKGVSTQKSGGAVYEHIDLTMNNGGPFDPAAYGGDAAKAKMVREAFLKAVPRQQILDTLIKPLNPNAVLDNSQMILPGAPGYDEMIKGNGSAAYDKIDLAGAKQLLAQAGVTTPVPVKFMYDKTNPRRANEFSLLKASVEKVGFKLVDVGNANWSSLLGNGSYDAIVFAWQNTGTNVTQAQPTFVADGGNNFNGYNNPTVNKLFAQLAATLDKDKQLAIQEKIEKQIWADAYGVTLYQFPQVTAWSDKVKNVSSAPLSPTFFWNYWEWELAA